MKYCRGVARAAHQGVHLEHPRQHPFDVVIKVDVDRSFCNHKIKAVPKLVGAICWSLIVNT